MAELTETPVVKSPEYLIFYHGGCPDGTCAAAIAQYYLIGNLPALPENFAKTLQLIPTEAGKVTAAVVKAHAKFPNPLIVLAFDLAVKQDEFDNLLKLYPKAKVYDHHQTTASCKPHPQLTLDQTISGAHLAWSYFQHLDTIQHERGAKTLGEMPLFVNYIEDRDLWKWKLPHSRDIASYMTTTLDTSALVFPSHTAVRDVWINHLSSDRWYDSAVLTGKAITAYENALVKRMTARHFAVRREGHLIAVVEAAELASELGEKLYQSEGTVSQELADYANVPTGTKYRYSYVLMWHYDDRDKTYKLSLRSGGAPFEVKHNDGTVAWSGPADVEQIARTSVDFLGGGGHKAAAGSKCLWPTIQGLIITSDPKYRIFSE